MGNVLCKACDFELKQGLYSLISQYQDHYLYL